MKNSGIDTPFFSDLAEKAATLKNAGINVVMGYLFEGQSFKQVVTLAAIKKYVAAGIGIEVVWESGSPTTDEYFRTHNGTTDGAACAKIAANAGVPKGSIIFAAVDYDCSNLALIKTYFTGFSAELLKAGYVVGVYGSGHICAFLTTKDVHGNALCTRTMLSGSTGWTGFNAWKTKCDILQTTLDTKILDIGCDYFTTNLNGWTV